MKKVNDGQWNDKCGCSPRCYNRVWHPDINEKDNLLILTEFKVSGKLAH